MDFRAELKLDVESHLWSEHSLTSDFAMTRASPLPAAARRAAIMAATEALLVSDGKAVTTRAIAEAAGIAEGTIFRVFPTKEAIIDAIFEDVFDPLAGQEELAAIDRTAEFEVCLLELVTVLQRRIRRALALFAAVGFRQPPSHLDHQGQRKLSYELVAAILRPHGTRLRAGPDETARRLTGLVLAMTHPMLTDQPMSDPQAIVDLALNGIALSKPGTGKS